MKPDQHKKKRNAQYKKKHGIKDNENLNALKDKKVQKGRSGQADSRPRETTGGTASSRQAPASESRGQTNAPSHTPGENSPVFRHREVASNWDRYEGLPLDVSDEEDDTAQRGADFQILLGSAQNAMSQFRFKDEQEWTEDDSALPDFLNLNPNEISAALDCIPLHQKLNIETEAFDARDLETFIDTARLNIDAYYSMKNRSVKSDAADIKSAQSLQSKILDGLKEQSQEVDPGTSDSSESDDFLNDLLSSNPQQEESSAVLGNLQNIVPQDEEGALDDLLNRRENKSSPEPEKSIQKEKEPPEITTSIKVAASPQDTSHTSQISKTQMTSIEDELDQLLTLDDEASEETKPRELCSNVKTNSGTESLDDWLDSVLDD